MRSMHLFVVGGALALSALSSSQRPDNDRCRIPRSRADVSRGCNLAVRFRQSTMAIAMARRRWALQELLCFLLPMGMPRCEANAVPWKSKLNSAAFKSFGVWRRVSHLCAMGYFTRRPRRNLGEVLVGDNGPEQAHRDDHLQAFALVVTADPTLPSASPAMLWSLKMWFVLTPGAHRGSECQI